MGSLGSFSPSMVVGFEWEGGRAQRRMGSFPRYVSFHSRTLEPRTNLRAPGSLDGMAGMDKLNTSSLYWGLILSRAPEIERCDVDVTLDGCGW